jgi:hypothetical protein
MDISLETVLLLLTIGGGWFWLDSLRVRELAINAGRQAAEQDNLQLLDETVAITQLWAARDARGRMRLQRSYSFEVSDTGSDRLQCSLTLLGDNVEHLNIPPHRDFTLHTIH